MSAVATEVFKTAGLSNEKPRFILSILGLPAPLARVAALLLLIELVPGDIADSPRFFNHIVMAALRWTCLVRGSYALLGAWTCGLVGRSGSSATGSACRACSEGTLPARQCLCSANLKARPVYSQARASER
jgi:hypothetical protein